MRKNAIMNATSQIRIEVFQVHIRHSGAAHRAEPGISKFRSRWRAPRNDGASYVDVQCCVIENCESNSKRRLNAARSVMVVTGCATSASPSSLCWARGIEKQTLKPSTVRSVIMPWAGSEDCSTHP